jgi:HEAT repeat protein
MDDKELKELLAGVRAVDWRDRLSAASHPLATELELIEAILWDPDRDVRLAAAENPNATETVLAIASRDEHPWVREAVAEHPNATIRLLKRLKYDPDPRESRAAKRALEKRLGPDPLA